MAGDWIKIRTNLSGDPAVKAMSRTLKLDVFSVVGRLHQLWSWADQHTDTGVMPFTVLDDVDDVVEKRGFAAELVRLHWLMDHGNEGIEIPKWERHNGDSAKKRCLAQERMGRMRQRNRGDSVTEESLECYDENVTLGEQKRKQRREEKSNTPIVPTGDTDLELTPDLNPDLAGFPDSASLLRARGLFRMRWSTPLDDSQRRAWKKNKAAVEATAEEDWCLLEWWFAPENSLAQFRRRDLTTLLNNWNAEISRASEEARKAGKTKFEKKEKAAAGPVEIPDNWSDIYFAVMQEECPVGLEWERLPSSVQARIIKLHNDSKQEEQK